MDKLFLASVATREHNNDLTKEPAARHMLREAESDIPTLSKQMDLRLAFALILISLLALFLIA